MPPNNDWMPLFPTMPAPGALDCIGRNGRPTCMRCGTQDPNVCALVALGGVYKCCPLHPEQWAESQEGGAA